MSTRGGPLRVLWFVLIGGMAVGTILGPGPFERGVRAYRQGQYEDARQILSTVFARNPAHVHDRLGSVAFWLGKVYRACGEPDSTTWAWSRGVAAMMEEGQFDAHLFDSYVQIESEANDSALGQAPDAYLALLRRASLQEKTSRTILRRHVAQALPLLGSKQRAHVLTNGGDEASDEWELRSNGGGGLAAWWEHQDPRPVTECNERLEEHLRRVAHADSAYAYEEDPARWDDRGDLYVRYGKPSRVHSIPFRDLKFIREIQRLGVGVSRGDFPNNVIWGYPKLGEDGAYLFVERDGRMQLSSATDLIPQELAGQFNASDRSRARAYSLLAAIKYIYRYLSMHYRDRGNVYSQVSSYLSKLEGLNRIQALRGNSGFPSSRIEEPSTAANDAFRQSQRQERNFARRRKERMPREHSEFSTPDARLPMSVRTARFLNEDGTTRTEIYWGNSTDSVAPSRGAYVVDLSARRYHRDYQPATRTTERHAVRPPEVNIAPRTTVLNGARGLYHLSLQWDQYTVSDTADGFALDEWTARRTVRVDSLHALSTDSTQLEMSDLRPLVPSGAQFDAANPTEQATPYPFPSWTLDTPLLLTFDVYHLQYTAEDRTEYEVAYEVERTSDRGGLLGLFGGDEVERTETASTYTGTQRRASESILLDWGDASTDGVQAVTVTVRVTDQTSGQTVERSIDFQVASPEDS